MDLLFALFAAASLAQVPEGQPVSPALNVDVTPGGFDAVEGFVPMLVPEGLSIAGPVGVYENPIGICWFGGHEFGVEVTNLDVGLSVLDVQITPMDPLPGFSNGYIDLHLQAEAWVNDAGNPFSLTYWLACIPDTCDAWVAPFTVDVFTQIFLDIVPDGAGNPTLQASLSELDIQHGLGSGDINLSGCGISFLDGVIFDLLLPILDDQLASVVDVQDLNDTLADALADINDQLVISEQIDLEGAVIDLFLEPSEVSIDSDGMRFGMDGGAVASEPAACIAKWDPHSSFATDSDVPLIGELPTILTEPYHVGAIIADEFVNQLLYAVWQSGILCIELGGPGPQLVDLPIALDSTMLGLLVPGVYEDLFPEPQPILLKIRPEEAPVLTMQPDDMALEIQNLGLEIYSEMDGRQAKIVDIGMGLDAGFGASFVPETGVIEIALALDDALSAGVLQNEFKPGTDEEVAAGIENLLSNPAIGGLLDDALADMAGFGLPPIDLGLDLDGDGFPDSFGVQDLVITTAGIDDDWIGAYVWIGPVDYEYAGCGGGCGDCGGSTSSSCTGCGSGTSGGCDPSQGLGCSGGSGGSSCLGASGASGCTATTGCTPGTAGSSSCGSGGGSGCSGSGGSCNSLSGALGGRVLAVLFAVLVIARRRRD